jgi:hypothetical protein
VFKHLLLLAEYKHLRDEVNDVTHTSQSSLLMLVLTPFVCLLKYLNSCIVGGSIIEYKTPKA